MFFCMQFGNFLKIRLREGTFTKLSIALWNFPLSFCKTCWIEDKRVAANTLEIWPNIVDIVKHFESLAPSKQPKNNKS